MANDKKKKKQIDERPLDPTRNAADLIGDTTGLTGVTQGSPKQSSAEPSDKAQLEDTAHLPGGVKDFPGKTQTGVPIESVSDKRYNDNAMRGMSDTYKAKAEEIASGNEDATSGDQDAISNDNQPEGPEYTPGNYSTNPSEGSVANMQPDEISEDNPTAKKTPDAVVPSAEGEQSVSGDMPEPGNDDDTLQNAQDVGTQLDEDPEHPEELDVARDVDKAEEFHREH